MYLLAASNHNCTRVERNVGNSRIFPRQELIHSTACLSDPILWPGICAKYFLSFPQKNMSPEKQTQGGDRFVKQF